MNVNVLTVALQISGFFVTLQTSVDVGFITSFLGLLAFTIGHLVLTLSLLSQNVSIKKTNCW